MEQPEPLPKAIDVAVPSFGSGWARKKSHVGKGLLLSKENLGSIGRKLAKDMAAGKLDAVTFIIEYGEETRTHSLGIPSPERILDAVKPFVETALDNKLAAHAEHVSYGGKTVLGYANKIRELIDAYRIETLLDYGCGNGVLYENGTLPKVFGLQRKNIFLYDKYVPRYSGLTDYKVDATLCIDVAEHVPRHRLDEMFTAIFLRTRKLFIMASCSRAAQKSFPDGTNVHVTIENYSFWTRQVSKHNSHDIPCVIWESS